MQLLVCTFLLLVDEWLRRSGSKLLAIVRDRMHHLLQCFVGHQLGQDAGCFGSLAPML